MEPNVILTNIGRDPLANKQDPADVLNGGKVYVVGVGVLPSEPPRTDSSLLATENRYITPHIVWASTEAHGRLMNIAISNLQVYVFKTPENIVNK